jgi:hypothetical protein
MIEADEDRLRSSGSESSTPWKEALSLYTPVAEAWLTLVADSRCAKDFYAILPVIVLDIGFPPTHHIGRMLCDPAPLSNGNTTLSIRMATHIGTTRRRDPRG